MANEYILRSLILAIVVVVAFVASAVSTFVSSASASPSGELSLKGTSLKEKESAKDNIDNSKRVEGVALKDLIEVYNLLALQDSEKQPQLQSNAEYSDNAQPQAITIASD